MTPPTLTAAAPARSATARTARVPGSKSITNRALLLAAVATGTSRLTAPSESADTLAFRAALTGLGAGVEQDGADWLVHGLGRAPSGPALLRCADAGTAARFLPVLAAAGHGEFRFEGSAQLTARPLRPLVSALTALGARVEPGPGGGLPLRIEASGLSGGELRLDSAISSQYLTGLLLSAPLMRAPLTVSVPRLVSRPYVEMTMALMRRFGAVVSAGPECTVRAGTGGYTATALRIEPDATAAAYLFAAAAATGGSVTVEGLGFDSPQGDLWFVEVLARAGAEVSVTERATTVTGTGRLTGGFEVDLRDLSDTFPALAVIAPLADGPVTVTGIGHARLKDSDRIAVVAENLRAGGVRVEEGADWITVHPGTFRPTTVATHRDHRIAMAFAVLALRAPGTTLDHPSCVDRTFPGFHRELHRLFGA
ncbi:3-phosphoshikimate 1-carboxyvinyltransferase [Kitasatospora sp. NPDC051853]|uniref:3-phosphoshikimate 1-carboxyvinyltransferase n=1 Tax=Kitasatospora sp. NPDC051853 TaxID=3364058 RepID=UPI0037AF2E08